MAINFPSSPIEGDEYTENELSWVFNGEAWDAIIDPRMFSDFDQIDNTSDADKPVSTLQAQAISVVQSDIDAHEARTDNPHSVTAAQVGLGSVDNTSDADKPVSTLQQAAIDAAGGGVFSVDANTQITPLTPIVLDQATGDEAALTLDYTTNKATSGDDTGLLINQTDTASPGTSKLMDLQVGGASRLSVTPGGGGARLIGTAGYSIGLYGGVTSYLYSLNIIGKLGFSYNAGPYLIRDAAGTLAQRNGVEAQISNIYNTDDGAGNAEWLSLGFSSGGDATIQAAKSGTGLSRPLFVRGQTLFLGGAVGANHWKISTAGHFLAQADNTYDIGAASANRPRNGYFSGTLDVAGYKKEGTTVLDYDSTLLNVSVGGSALGDALLTGTSNTATGYAALSSNTTGSGNTANGRNALQSNDTGDNNTANGQNALLSNTDGTSNTAAGYAALFSNDTGSNNTASGRSALELSTSGSGNTASGYAALQNNTTGGYNTAVGYQSGRYLADGVTALTDASNSVFIGRDTRGVNSATNQVVIGDTAESIGANSVVLGNDSIVTTALKGTVTIASDLLLNRAAAATLQLGEDHATTPIGQTIKAHDVVTGTGADLTLSGGLGSVANGDIILSGNVHASQITGTENNFVGAGAGESNSGNNSSGFGYQSLYQNIGNNNTASGYQSLRDNAGDNNTASGVHALRANTGSNNTASGYWSLYSNTGDGNTATGYFALRSNIGDYNTASGFNSLYGNNGSYNTASGWAALQQNTGSNNTASGTYSLYQNTGGNNTASGTYSLHRNAGDYNTASGSAAGLYQSGGNTALTTASNSVFLGATTKGIQGATNQIVIGDTAESIGANSVVLGNDSIVTTALRGNVGIGTTTPGAALDVATTWNDGATVFTGIKADVTNTASAVDSKLIDLQVGGASKFSVLDTGGLTISDGSTAGGPTMPYLTLDTAWGDVDITHWGGILSFRGAGLTGLRLEATTATLGWSTDLILGRDAPGTLAQRNGVEAQTYNIYNTDDGAGNYERGHIGWNDTADTFVIGTEAGGTGGPRKIRIQGTGSGGAAVIEMAPGHSGIRWIFNNNGGELYPNTDNAHDIGLWSRRVKDIYAAGTTHIDQGTLTDDAQALNITSTWDDAADTFTLIKADVTNTASAADSKLLDLQVGGASKFSVDAGGEVFGSGVNSRLRLTDSVGAELEYSNWRIGIGGPIAYFYQTTIAKVGMGADGLRLADSGALRWSSGSQASTGHDLLLTRDSAATLQLGENHGTTPTGQTIKAHDVVTGTGADLTLSGGLGDVANGAVILSGDDVIVKGVSTGADGIVRLGSGGNAYIYSVSAGGALRVGAGGATRGAWTPTGLGIGTTAPATALDVAGSANITGTVKTTPTTVGALPAAATAGAGARTFVTDSANSLSSHHGQTVSGGGVHFSPVYSDGANWLVG